MTSMSGASERVSRMPRRMSAWSSQRNTLIMCVVRAVLSGSYVGPLARVVGAVGLLLLGQVVGAVGHVERHREDQGRAVRPARQVDPAADGVGPLVQAADAERA